ncbi:hypothetical protein SAMN05660297_03223 [Natronincola peptidivorans]|uniref:4Fe-4S ferredoxin-type domain-containing protein n=1 Tax=Natronincola peptidivorans TaxID=426128 RepID=A0A1I0GJT9_9FIRM|nr:hypothetical protein [Natronincola peptidivorans]SET70625.1 hypothetical protein SAMN05660297_03223 [Natronincola peptidivorans]
MIFIFFTAYLILHNEVLSGNFYDLCGKCITGCPAKALSNLGEGFTHDVGYTIEKERCSYYQHTVLGGKRCGICAKVCSLR